MPPLTTLLSNNENGLGGMPWWIKAIPTVGVPSVIAIGLSWYLVDEVRSELGVVRTQLAAHATQMTIDQNDQRQRARDLIYMLRQVCFNTARTDAQRDGCRSSE